MSLEVFRLHSPVNEFDIRPWKKNNLQQEILAIRDDYAGSTIVLLEVCVTLESNVQP